MVGGKLVKYQVGDVRMIKDGLAQLEYICYPCRKTTWIIIPKPPKPKR